MALTERKPLSLRDWLELGQVLTDKSRMGPRWFRGHSTESIFIGRKCALRANGKRFGPGYYYLDRSLPGR